VNPRQVALIILIAELGVIIIAVVSLLTGNPLVVLSQSR
jgi:hypothetical protein